MIFSALWAFPAPLNGQEKSEEDLKGVYESVELTRSEPNDLIDTAAQYQDLFERRSLIYGEPHVVEMVARIGSELAPEPTDDYIDYRFAVIRDPSPNAFALPNGHIYVHTGLLARMDDRSQLAALLAHEINHVAGHHTILRNRLTGKRILIGLTGIGTIFGQLRYSRKLEEEADNRAAQLLEGTDYDPHAMTDLLEILAQDIEGLNPRLGTIWSTHPDPEKRIETNRENLADIPRKPRDPAAFDAVIYPLRILTIRDYIQDDYPYTAMHLASKYMELYPGDLDFRMALGDAYRVLGPRPTVLPEDFDNGDAWRNAIDRLRDSRQQRIEELLETPEGIAAMQENLALAVSTFNEILAIDPGYAAAHRGLGGVYEAEGNDREAARAYLSYLQAEPDAADRPVILRRLTEIRDRLVSEETNP